jgi:NarL family two-component system sensor histidine kinase YdfH
LGEILGMFRRSRSALVYSLFVLGVSFVSYLAVTEGLQAWVWIATAVPIAVFVWLYVALYTRQVQAREQTQLLLTELEEAHHQLAEYATRVEDLTLVAERQRLARELHDTLAQGLAGLILQLEAADSHLGSQNPEKAQAIVQQAMTRARATLADARRAIGDLRATALAPADLNAAIRAEAERFTHTTGIPCALNLCEAGRISPQTAENALRTVSEGLMNIARHAQATAASLSLTCDEDHLWVEIHDNGVGFDPAGVVGHSGHFGLLGLRERARLLGGLLTIESQPSQGATLKIQLPLAGNQNPSQPLTS